jgi:lipopolysaccharide transport protein LptA
MNRDGLMKTLDYAVAALALALAAPLAAMPAAAAGNVSVQADDMEIIDAEHKTIFRGNVVATRPSETITAEEMTVVSSDEKQADGSTKSVTDHIDAKGKVTITTHGTVITGDAAHIDSLHDHMIVTGSVTLTQGGSTVQGQKLDVDTKSFHVQMTGGRVTAVVAP